MARKLQWGIIGAGNIARQFCAGLATSERTVPWAVGSRAQDKSNAFAAAFAIPNAYAGYEPVLADPKVDAVYIALPNSMHHEWTIKALRAGKHVLCEKPIASCQDQAREMFDVARQSGKVLVEAFMYRCHPLTRAVLAAVKGGAIGNLKLIRTSFCFNVRHPESNSRFSMPLAGGGLMDIGCYCIDFSRLIAGGQPRQVQAFGHLHPTGIDDVAAAVMRFDNDVLASFTCGMSVQVSNAAFICGDQGFIEVPVPWKPSVTGSQWILDHGTPPLADRSADAALKAPPPTAPPRQVFTVDAGKELFALEADDFAATIFDGAAPVVSEADSLGNMAVLDQMRKQVGVAF